MLSPLILRMLIYIFLLLSINIIFLQFVWQNTLYHQKGLPFWLATAPRVFTALTKSILFVCHHKGFSVLIYLDDILVLIHSKWTGKRAQTFQFFIGCLELHINFSKCDLSLTQIFCF